LSVVLAAFLLVYAGMILGRIPGLAIDRPGIALLGGILLVASGHTTLAGAWAGIDPGTIGLLFGLMVVSAQLRLGGFYTRLTRWLAAGRSSPERLLFGVVVASGGLSALLANDIVCLAVAPVLADGCARRRLDPVPFLLGLAAAANVGSAATLIGNPQNMLIGERLELSFAGYLLDAAVPASAGLLLTWWILARAWRGRFARELALPPIAEQPFDAWQTAKGAAILGALVVAFLLGSIPRDVAALGAAGLLLLSRRLHSREMLGLVDWQLVVLFAGLFVVNHELLASGLVADALAGVGAAGIELREPAALFGATVLLSNVVSNVPAVMLLLPAATHPQGGSVLALASTLAGNLFLVGSIANLIVVEQARRLGIEPRGQGWFAAHVRVGVPITLGTLALAAGWLALRAA
jgi:Na+/H+ antiporter NhaD/arsenite permease-like protein